jgi:hypothetical protein
LLDTAFNCPRLLCKTDTMAGNIRYAAQQEQVQRKKFPLISRVSLRSQPDWMVKEYENS